MKRIIAQARKELTQLSRDKLALALALVLPVILLLLLGSAISLSVTDLPVAVNDLDQTPTSRKYADAFQQSLTFHLVPVDPVEQPEQLLLTNRARAVIVIPPSFERDLVSGGQPEVQILVDATDPNTANIMRGTSTAINQAFVQGLRAPGSGPAVPVRLHSRLWFNPGRESRKFFGPGIFVLGLSLFPPLLAALAMARERELSTILQVYTSSITAHEFLLGKILAFTMVALAEWVLGLVIVLTVFGLRFVGDPTPFLVGSLAFLTSVVCFGVMVGARIPQQAAAVQAISIGGFIMAFLLSGLIFPVENIPRGMRWVSAIAMARYYVLIVRDALIRGGGWPAVWWAVAVLILIASIFYFLAWWRMRRMQLDI